MRKVIFFLTTLIFFSYLGLTTATPETLAAGCNFDLIIDASNADSLLLSVDGPASKYTLVVAQSDPKAIFSYPLDKPSNGFTSISVSTGGKLTAGKTYTLNLYNAGASGSEATCTPTSGIQFTPKQSSTSPSGNANCSFSISSSASSTDTFTVSLTGPAEKYYVSVLDYNQKTYPISGYPLEKTDANQTSFTVPTNGKLSVGTIYNVTVSNSSAGTCNPTSGLPFSPAPPNNPGSPLPTGDSSVKNPTRGLFDPTSFVSLGDIISKALPLVYSLVVFFAVIVFVIGALRYLASMGDPKATEGARGTMTGAVVGLVIVLGAAFTSEIFANIFGVSLFGTTNKPSLNGNSFFDLGCAFKLTTGRCIGQSFTSFGDLVTQILLLLLSVGGLVFFFMLLWGGLRYMLSRGDEKAVASSRSTLGNAFVGLLLMIGGIVIIRLIASVVFKFSF